MTEPWSRMTRDFIIFILSFWIIFIPSYYLPCLTQQGTPSIISTSFTCLLCFYLQYKQCRWSLWASWSTHTSRIHHKFSCSLPGSHSNSNRVSTSPSCKGLFMFRMMELLASSMNSMCICSASLWPWTDTLAAQGYVHDGSVAEVKWSYGLFSNDSEMVISFGREEIFCVWYSIIM